MVQVMGAKVLKFYRMLKFPLQILPADNLKKIQNAADDKVGTKIQGTNEFKGCPLVFTALEFQYLLV
jgi:hypothetical protein